MNAETITPPAAAPQPLGEQLFKLSCDGYIVADQIASIAYAITDALDRDPQPSKDAIGRVFCLAMVIQDLASRATDLVQRIELASNAVGKLERAA